ncbi:flavin reductase [Arthrobacter nitrophenolicus]|uniref:Flavin reductase n=1 Tax=Arthrobacter nitrophenolicus TaxID=683150 RepID=A0A4R5Y5B0_9MICC|nr:flavin reductase [Arthrobacter nitrophenolicus]TDL38827.1 flavin reductase [Arthrobacter nitrophenolicus]
MQQTINNTLTAAWTAAWDEGDVNAFDAIVTADYQRESAGKKKASGLKELQQEILDIRAAFPDLTTRIDKVIADGDDVAIFWTSTGTFTNTLHGVPPTGRVVETRGSNALTLRDGLIAHERVTWDAGELLADLGVPSLQSAFEDEAPDIVVDNLSGDLPLDIMKGFNRQFITGVTVVTTVDDEGKPRGLAANSYASISLDPPLVLVCVQKTSSTYSALFQSSHLGINILSNEQLGTVRTFASKAPDKFADLEWHAGPNGVPLIDGSSASLEAEIKERFQAKTHTIFVGRVRHAEVADVDPMVYKAGHFFDGARLEEL